MKYLEERAYLEGLARVIEEKNIDKVKLNIGELLEMSMCESTKDEMDIMQGLLNNLKDVEALGKCLRKGSDLSKNSLMKIVGEKCVLEYMKNMS